MGGFLLLELLSQKEMSQNEQASRAAIGMKESASHAFELLHFILPWNTMSHAKSHQE